MMSDYSTIGLGISFDAMPLSPVDSQTQYTSAASRPRPTSRRSYNMEHTRRHTGEMHFVPTQGYSQAPYHKQAHSMAIPQHPFPGAAGPVELESSHMPQQQQQPSFRPSRPSIRTTASARPAQRPFTSPVSSGRSTNTTYVHSAPGTPYGSASKSQRFGMSPAFGPVEDELVTAYDRPPYPNELSIPSYPTSAPVSEPRRQYHQSSMADQHMPRPQQPVFESQEPPAFELAMPQQHEHQDYRPQNLSYGNAVYPQTRGYPSARPGSDPFEENVPSYFTTPVLGTPYQETAPTFRPMAASAPSLLLQHSHHDSFHVAGRPQQALGSPCADLEGDFEGERHGYFDEADEMPEEPYVAEVCTQWPPARPAMPTRSFTEETGSRTDYGSGLTSYTSPVSSGDELDYSAGVSHDISALSSPGNRSPSDKKVAYSRWTAEEDVLLRDAIAKYGDGKWSLISQSVPGRTPMQCSTRWQGALNTSIHKGRWEPEEDAILVKAVSEWQAWHAREMASEGSVPLSDEDLTRATPWAQIAGLLPRPRTGVQALARWSEALDPRITKGKWTVDEDMSLMRGVARYGKCWIKIAQGVVGRTQRQCRTRYCQIADKKRKSSQHPAQTSAAKSQLNDLNNTNLTKTNHGKGSKGAAAAAAAFAQPQYAREISPQAFAIRSV
ncbi:myb-like DNA-binding protein bas1 [Savitreella phatthalungensis]